MQDWSVPLIFAQDRLPQLGDALLRVAVTVVPVWCFVRFQRARRLRAEDGWPADDRGSFRHELLWLAAVLYGCVVAAVTLYPLASLTGESSGSDPLNLIPFRAWYHCATEIPKQAFNMSWFCMAGIAGNIALFVPLGIFLPILSRAPKRMGEVVLLALWVSLGIEVAQGVEHALGVARTPDVDDVILNVMGAWLGGLIARLMRRDGRPLETSPALR